MKRMKRALSLLLTLVMVLGCLSGLTLTANAETVEYDLWIGGLQVTSDNCRDVLGDGTISYDPTTATLYLNNAYVTSGTKSSAVIYNDTGSALTIDVTGVNQIGSTSYAPYGIKSDYRDFHITGSGTLNVYGSRTALISQAGIVYFDEPTGCTTANFTGGQYGMRVASVYIGNAKVRAESLCTDTDRWETSTSVCTYAGICAYSYGGGSNPDTISVGNVSGGTDSVAELTAICEAGAAADCWALFAKGSIRLADDEVFASPAGASVSGTQGTSVTVVDSSSARAQSVSVKPRSLVPYDIETSELWINGVQVTMQNKDSIPGLSGCSFDEETNTLYLSGNLTFNQAMPASVPDCAIYSTLRELYIELASGCTVTASGKDYGIVALDSEAVHIRGGGSLDLTADRAAILCDGSLFFDESDTTLQPTATLSAGLNAVRAGNIYLWNVDLNAASTGTPGANDEISDFAAIAAANDAGNGGVLQIGSNDTAWKNNATVYAENADACAIYAQSSMDLGSLDILLPERYLSYNSMHHTLRDADTGSAATTVSLRPAEEAIGTTYDLWVGGVQVCLANKNDVLGDGAVRYDPATHTLYLDNAEILSYYDSDFYGDSHIFYKESDALTIVLSGENAIGRENSGGQNGEYGIQSLNADVHVVGSGSLQIWYMAFLGIECGYQNSLYFDDAVNRPTVTSRSGRHGIHARNIYVERAELYVTCNAYLNNDGDATAILAEGLSNDTAGGILQIGRSTGDDNVILEAGVEEGGRYAVYAKKQIVLQNNEKIVTPEGGGIYNKSTVIDRYGATVLTVRIEPHEPALDVNGYNLWLNGARVTDDNKDGLPGLEGCSFDPSTNTLYLTGDAVIDQPMILNNIACAVYSALPDLYIELDDDCYAQIAGYGNGIYAASGCNVHIRGGGTLSMYDIADTGIRCAGGGGKIYFDGQDPDVRPVVQIEAGKCGLCANFIYLWNVNLEAVVTKSNYAANGDPYSPIKALTYQYIAGNAAHYDGGVVEIGSDTAGEEWKNNAVIYATCPYNYAIFARSIYGSSPAGAINLSAGERVWIPNNTNIVDSSGHGDAQGYHFRNTTTNKDCSTVYIAPSGEIPDAEIEYELWVNGVQVTGENADFLPGMGGSYFDPVENTLHLSGRITVNAAADGKPDAPIYTTMENLTIALDFGRAEIASEEHDYGIYSTRNLRIVGDGMLTVSKATKEGIHVGGTLTLDDPECKPVVSAYARQYAVRTGSLVLKEGELNAILLTADHTAGDDAAAANAAILTGTMTVGTASDLVSENNVTVFASCDVSGGYGIYAKNSAQIVSSYVDVIKPVNYSWSSGSHYVRDGSGNPARIVSIATKVYYDIEVDEGVENGVLELLDHTDGRAFPGSTVTFRTVPEEGYRCEGVDIYYNDEASTTYTLTGNSFVMPSEDVYLTATFYISGHAVNIANLVGGTIQANCRLADPNTRVELTVTPDEGYRLVGGVTVTGESGNVIPSSYTWFTMPDEDVTVSAVFTKIDYSITINDGGYSYGHVVADRSTATIGDTVTLTLNMQAGYQLAYMTAEAPLIGETVNLKRTGDNTYQFTMPAAPVIIDARFEQATFAIDVAPMEHGSIRVQSDGQETTTARYEKTVSLTVLPDSGYELKSLRVTHNDDSHTEVNIYRESRNHYYFYMPASNVTITAVIGPVGETITVNITGCGTVVPDKDVVPAGEPVTLTVTPEEGWELSSLQVFNSQSDELTVSEDYTFTMPNLPVTVEAVFVHVDHCYGDPVWTWDANSATASFTCTVCGQEETAEATVTAQELPGQTDLTATVTFAGETYTDTQTVYKTWNIYVGGVQITGRNYQDILGDGTTAYAPLTNTLTLTNAQIEVVKLADEAFGIRYNENTNATTQLPLRIELNGVNTITDAQPDEEVIGAYGICAFASSPGYIITGTGSLDVTMQADKASVRYYGVHVRKALTVDGASVKVHLSGTAASVGVDLVYNDSILHLVNGASVEISVGGHADTAALASNRNVACLDVTAGCSFVARSDNRAFHEFVSDHIERVNLTDASKDCGVLVGEENDRESAASWDENTALSSYKYVAIPAIVRTVSFAAVEGGTAGMDRETVYDGQTVTLTATPNAGYTFSHYAVTDAQDQTVALRTENSFVMPASDVTVTPSFLPIDYTVSVLENANGAVSVSGDPERAHVGDTITLTASPATGYVLQGYAVTDENNQTVALAAEDSFVMPACSVTVEAVFVLADYSVLFSDVTGGTADATPNPAHMGDTVTLTADTAAGYRFNGFAVAEGSGQPVALVTENTFVMPASDVTVMPLFTAIDYTIAVLPTSNGTVTVNKSTAHVNDEIVFTVTPAEGCALQKLIVYDFSYNTYPVTENKLTMPAANLIVVATFTDSAYSITIAGMQHGNVTASQNTAAAGTRITLTVTPESGYKLSSLTVTDGEGAALPVQNNQFTMPASNVTVAASFLATNPTLVYFVGNSLTLAGDIGINFYVQLNDVPQNSAKIVFTWGKDQTKTMRFSELTADGSGRYKTFVQVAAAEMTDTVTAKLYDGETLVAEQQYSVAQYARYVLGASDAALLPLVDNDQEKVDSLRALCKAMLIYGAKSQLQFKYNLYALADQGLAYTIDDVGALGTTVFPDGFEAACGIRYYGSSLVLETKTSYRLYFTVTDQAKLDAMTVKLGGDTLTYGTRDDYVYFEIPDIAAAYVFRDYTLTFGDIAVTANAGEYIINVLAGSDQTLKDVVKALYWYSMAAKTYFDVE